MKRAVTSTTSSPNKRPKSSGFWHTGLLESMKDSNLIVQKDDEVVVIKDKFPKAKYHFLVLPHEDISSLTKVTNENIGLLKHMETVGRSVADRYPDVDFRFGYHAAPSMSRLHLHVISQDFDSPCLKTKKHWNSFTTTFFRDSKDVVEELAENGKIKPTDHNLIEALMKSDLKCHRCSSKFQTIPKLKDHLKACSKK